jgi:flavodoxin
MKNLIIYYSLNGNTDFVAKAIAKITGGDILRLKQQKEFNPRGFTKLLKGGIQILFKTKPLLEEWEIKPSDYELIFVGSPVWAGSYVPALNTFFSYEILQEKKIGLFSTWGGSAGNVFQNMKILLKDNELIEEIGFNEPLKQTTEKKHEIESQISDFVEKVVQKSKT